MLQLGQLTVAVAAALLLLLGPAVLGTWFILRRKRLARRERRSPLTRNMLRQAGHSLRVQFEDRQFNIVSDIVMLMMVPSYALASLFLVAYFAGRHPPTWTLIAALVGVAAFTVYQVRKLLLRSKQIDWLRLGLDAEMAVGQELDQLMREGAVVFHDFPAEKFNIDHVVIAPQGVFAVETKGFRKPNRALGAADATVVLDGRGLAFPEWSSSKPIDQAQRQAHWFSNWLSGATGERVRATPVLALPGWFVDRRGRGEITVLSGMELGKHLLKARSAEPLTPEQVQRIVHQVEQRCRSVEPSYRPDEEDR